MKFILKTFDEIVNGFDDSKRKLTEKYSKLNTESLHQPRRHQVQFIEKSIELIGNHENNAKILTSLILLQMCVIGRSSGILGEDIYKALEPNSTTRSGLRASSYFNSLMKDIGYSETNTLEFADVTELLGVAKQFIEAQIYVNANPLKGISKNHPYQIGELDILQYLKIAVIEIYESTTKNNRAVYEFELKLLTNNERKLKDDSLGKAKKENEKKRETEDDNKFQSRLTYFMKPNPVLSNDVPNDVQKQTTEIMVHNYNGSESDSDSYGLIG